MTDSPFTIIRDVFRARAGKKLAQQEIGALMNGSLKVEVNRAGFAGGSNF
jgi:hypothetical protein